MSSAVTTPLATSAVLAALAAYYLECLAQDEVGVRVFASGKDGPPDYVELPAFPDSAAVLVDTIEGGQASRLVRKLREDRASLSLLLGWPVHLAAHTSPSGWSGFFVEPLLLFPVGLTSHSQIEEVDLENPQLNFRALASLTGLDGSALADQAISLADELGLLGSAAEWPGMGVVLERLQGGHPEWSWREPLVLSAPVNAIGLPNLHQSGIYSRTILMLGEASPYTRGLERELGRLRDVGSHDVQRTALGDWLAPKETISEPVEAPPLVEIVPINTEQRLAVQSALSQPLTVVTGPPGTGKSQVVASVLVNCVFRGQSVLFASKNHKAVDVVQERVNQLGSRPVLLRLGRDEHRRALADFLTALLSSAVTQEEEVRYAAAELDYRQVCDERASVERQLAETVSARNLVDSLEIEAELSRQTLGEDLFRCAPALDLEAIAAAVTSIEKALCRSQRRLQTALVRLLWPLLRAQRRRAMADTVAHSSQLWAKLEVLPPLEPLTESTLEAWTQWGAQVRERVSHVATAQSYHAGLHRLCRMPSPEDSAREILRITQRLGVASRDLWRCWLALQPARLEARQRREVSEFASIQRMVAESDEQRTKVASRVFARQYELFERVSQFLPAWAVTSLSAAGRLPWAPGFFDLLIVDEASQCDIASVLPLLFRAKRVMIIGDPQQLRHISSIRPTADAALLSKYGLEDHVGWAYSSSSVFDLAAGIAGGRQIVSLRDHHRSHPDIIGFSNEHFYEGRLRVATHHSRLRIVPDGLPVVRWVDVKGRAVRPASGGLVNAEEASAVLRELRELVLVNGYDGSVGVVSPFRAQANRIRHLVYEDDALGQRLSSMDFICDTAHKFQGDERDVMLFSPAIAAGDTTLARGFLRNQGNVFNVAVTRARAGLIVVGDWATCAGCDVPHLRHFAEYVTNLDGQPQLTDVLCSDLGPEYPPVADPEIVSEWERTLYRALFSAGLRPLPQYAVEGYLVDMALFSGDRRLAIEVDGEQYHRAWTGELCRRDQIRNQRLLEVGWDVTRFWVYQVRDDLETCVAKIHAWADGSIPSVEMG